MWLNQSQPVSIDTLSCKKGASASESFNRGHLDNSPQGVWEGCKYKWQLPPPSRASSAKQPSLLFFSSLQREKKSCSEQGQSIASKKVFFFVGNQTVCIAGFRPLKRYRSYNIRSQVWKARGVSQQSDTSFWSFNVVPCDDGFYLTKRRNPATSVWLRLMNLRLTNSTRANAVITPHHGSRK